MAVFLHMVWNTFIMNYYKEYSYALTIVNEGHGTEIIGQFKGCILLLINLML